METVSIRDLRGSGLANRAHPGELLGITNYRQLIGVFVPMTPTWVEHLIEYNWSHVRQSVVEGERELATGAPMTTLDGLLADSGGQQPGAGQADGDPGDSPKKLAAAAMTALALGGNPGQLPPVAEVFRRFRGALGGSDASADERPSVRTVRVGDLSARVIEEAGGGGQTLALTHDRVLAGIVVPVTRGLVEFLVEQNMSRLLYNIGLGEKEISEGGPLTTLGQVTADRAESSPAESSPEQDCACQKH